MPDGKIKSIHGDAYRILVGLLRVQREQTGFTQINLAALIGTDQSFVSKYERCERRLDVIEVRQVCSALGISLETFVVNFEAELRKKGLA